MITKLNVHEDKLTIFSACQKSFRREGKLTISHSGMSEFLTCRRIYYYKYIMRLELNKLNIAFLVGRVLHIGISAILQGKKDAIAITLKEAEREIALIRRQHPEITAEQETKLNELLDTIPSMLTSYRTQYAKFLKTHEHIEEELPFEYELNDRVTIVGKIDNVLRHKVKKHFFVHEAKTSRYISVDYIRAIQTDAQSTLYNIVLQSQPSLLGLKSIKMAGVVYDVMMKPSIRQKQKESRAEFSRRLIEWYQANDGSQRFHMEIIKQPLITPTSLLNTYTRATNDILAYTEKDQYYQNFHACVRDWGLCDYHDLCFMGESKETLLQFRYRQQYKVTDELKKAVKKKAKLKGRS